MVRNRITSKLYETFFLALLWFERQPALQSVHVTPYTEFISTVIIVKRRKQFA